MLSLETVKELMMGMISTDEVMTAVVGSTPLNQATNGITASWEVPVVRRYNGQRSISAQCNNAPGYTANDVRNSLLPKIETLNSTRLFHGMARGVFGKHAIQTVFV